MNSLVSVIIPVYKVEKYIEKCMQSLLDQTYTNFEALIVDDGSPDDSIKLAKALVGDDPRFIFFEKENGGQGTARNLALDHAKGEYVAFLDSDDTYTPDMLSVTIGELHNNTSIDVLVFGINYVSEDGVLLRKVFKESCFLNTDNDVLLMNKKTTNFFWDKVFKRKVISKYRFSSFIRTYEDVDLLYQVLYGCNIKLISGCFYNYTQRVGSTVKSLPPSFIDDKVSIACNAKSFLIEKNLLQGMESYYNSYYLNEVFYKALSVIVRYSKDYNRDVKYLLLVSNTDNLNYKNIYRLMLEVGLKESMVLSVFKINSNLFKFLFDCFLFIRKYFRV